MRSRERTPAASRTSIRSRIAVAFLLVVIIWGIFLSTLLQAALRGILKHQLTGPEVVGAIANRFTLISTGLTLAGIVVFLLVALYFARLISEPVKRLTEAVTDVARGDAGVLVEVSGNDELAELALAFNRMAEQVREQTRALTDSNHQLQEVDRIKTEFISTAAHELRTPLTAVLGYSELLLEDNGFSPEERRQFLSHIHQKAEVLARIVDELLDLSRIESGRIICVNKETVRLEPQVWQLVEQYRRDYPSHRFELELPPGTRELVADQGKMMQVLENLLSNAVKYSPAGGRIGIAVAWEGDRYRLQVADEGIGMAPEQVARAFEKFYRANASNTAVSGLGLGLTITRNIVEAHGGEILLESEPGKGTRVTLSIPGVAA